MDDDDEDVVIIDASFLWPGTVSPVPRHGFDMTTPIGGLLGFMNFWSACGNSERLSPDQAWEDLKVQQRHDVCLCLEKQEVGWKSF